MTNSPSRQDNIKAAVREVRFLQDILKEAKAEIKYFQEKQQKNPFEWYVQPILQAQIAKTALIHALTYIAHLGKDEFKRFLIESVLTSAATPSRSTSPITNLKAQEELAANAKIYQKLFGCELRKG